MARNTGCWKATLQDRHQRPHQQQRCQETKHAHDDRLSRQSPLCEQEARQQSASAVSKHLPWSIGSLTIEEVAGKGRDRAHKEPGFGAKGNTRQHDNGENRLEIGNGNNHPRGHRQSGQHRDDHQLPRLRLPVLESQQKRHQRLNHDQRAGDIVGASAEPQAEINRCGDQQQEDRQHHDMGLFHFAVPSVIHPPPTSLPKPLQV